MSGPGKPIEECIKAKLVSDDPDVRSSGLTDAVVLFEKPLWGRLRRWSNNKSWGLDSSEIKNCVQETMLVLWRLVRARKFKQKGSLRGLLSTIAYRRAVDLMRKRSRVELHEHPSVFSDTSPPAFIDINLLEEFKCCFKHMHDDRRIVVIVYIELRIYAHPKRVTMAELTDEVNKRHNLSLPVSTVKSRLDRGRGEFRELLEKRGRDA